MRVVSATWAVKYACFLNLYVKMEYSMELGTIYKKLKVVNGKKSVTDLTLAYQRQKRLVIYYRLD